MTKESVRIEMIVPPEIIENKIFFVRGKKVRIDRDLAKLYEVETKALNQAVKRNLERFPKDFMFQLTAEEAKLLRSQIVTLKHGQHLKYLPYVFTEHGILMLSSFLKSKRAVQVTSESCERSQNCVKC
jgi:aromatic ring-opening dioxygenase LigB subunit